MTSNDNEWATLTVQWFDASDGYVSSADITDDVVAIPLFTDTGSEEVNEANVEIDADFGDHIAATPAAFEEHDRIRINCIDLNGNEYDRYFEVDSILPSESKGEGTRLSLECLGTEYHTQNIKVHSNRFFAAPQDMAQSMGDIYNKNRGQNRQPLLASHDSDYNATTEIGNGLPDHVRTHFEFGVQDSTYNRWLDILDALSQPVAGSGVLDFFDIAFDATAVQQIDMRAFSSGIGPNTATVTIQNTTTISVSEQEGIIENPEGTHVFAMGDANSGSLPLGHAKYRSAVFQFLYRPHWSETVAYATSSTVFLEEADAAGSGGTHWRSKKTDTGTTPSTSDSVWGRITMASEFGNTDAVSALQYSPWTDDKARLWVNCGGSPSDAVASPSAGDDNGFENGGNCAFFDQNIVINTSDFFRTFANERVHTDGGKAADTKYQYESGQFPVGYRLLCVNRGNFVAGTKDRYGQEFTNCVAEFVESRETPSFDDHEWIVKYSANSTNNRMQVVVRDESTTYEWRSTSSTWVDMGASASIFDLANDCIHKWTSVSNVNADILTDFRPYQTSPSLFPEITTGSAFTGNQNSAVQFEYDFGAITDRATSPSAYLARGAWAEIRAPWPPSTHGGISENVGDLYGGGTRSSATWSVDQPSMFDFGNMTYSYNGLQGYNQPGDASESLGEIQGIHIQLGVEMSANMWGNLGGVGNFRCVIVDRADNLWHQDVETPIFQQGTGAKAIGVPLNFMTTGFQPIRSHKPRWAELNNNDPVGFVTPKEQDVQAVFEWRNVLLIQIYWLGAYDKFGRFNPEGNLTNLSETSLINAFGGNIKMKIDDYFLITQLVASSDPTSTYEIQTEFLERPDIILYDQLKNFAKAELEKQKFKRKEFDIRTAGEDVFDIRFGNSFYFTNTHIVTDADNGDNTIKLVAKRIEYSITKPPGGVGGLTRRIIGIKRFT